MPAQDYQVRFDQVFDNREYFSDYGFAQTIFGAGLDARLFFRVDTIHSFAAGFNYFFEHGSSISGVPLKINLYYQYKHSNFTMYFGSVPRKGKLDFSRSFLNDTLNYYRPNIEGALVTYNGKAGWLRFFADWTGRVTKQRRETFLIGLESRLKAEKLFFQPSILMYHNARNLGNDDQPPLQDNGIMSALFGFEIINPDYVNMELSTGLLASYNRFRPAKTTWTNGIKTSLDLSYNILGLESVYYYGNPVDFTYGDPFYRSGNYGRADLYIDPFKSSKVESKIGWSFHFIKGDGINHSQQILISVTF